MSSSTFSLKHYLVSCIQKNVIIAQEINTNHLKGYFTPFRFFICSLSCLLSSSNLLSIPIFYIRREVYVPNVLFGE